jgi:hypothetical protein
MPSDTEHVAIIGRNGSGKTQFATWMLSERSYDKMPWIVLNFKGDDLIDEIPGHREMAITDAIPKSPGIYVTSPVIASKEDQALLDDFFRRCWERQNVGIYVDEGYMATGLKWFRAVLSQGRSRHVPMIVISQRPVWMDRFVWSEASRYAAFDLNLQDDKETADKMIPGYRQVNLPAFHSVWHDVKSDRTVILTPAPDRETILAAFRSRAKVKTKAI